MLNLEFSLTPLAMPFLFAIALVFPAVVLWTFARGRFNEVWLLSLFAVTMTAVLLARSVAAFVLAWESMTLVSALLVATHYRRRDVRRAAFAYLVISQLGALCVIVALAMLATHAETFSFSGIAGAARTLPKPMRLWILALSLVGFGSKAGIVPLHFWLPRAHPAAPANASALLSGVMLGIALFGMMQMTEALAAPVPASFALITLGIGAVTATLGGLYAAIETDIKQLLAYSSIENVGIVVAALGLAELAGRLGVASIAGLALVAAFFHVISHAIFKSLLFLVAGVVADANGTTDLEHLGGLARTLRFSAAFAFVGCLAAAALPPTVGFASEWFVFRSFIEATVTGPQLLRMASIFALTAVVFGTAFAALAYLKLFGVGFLGASQSTHQSDELERADSSAASIGWLALATLIVGLLPAFVLDPLAHVVRQLGFMPPELGSLPALPTLLTLLPLAGAFASLIAGTGFSGTRVRRANTWTCGSPVPVRSKYTATAFANPIVIIFTPALRFDVDDVVRTIAAGVRRIALRLRIVQGGLLRVYLAYAVIALVIVLVVAAQ